jgi:hypothetical protein
MRRLCCARLTAAALTCFTQLASAADDASARTRAILLSAPTWVVRWAPPDEAHEYIAVVRFRQEGGALVASAEHPDGSTCYPDIRVLLLRDGFLFFGCTGVPKEMHYDPADPEAPFKGRAFGFRYRWTPSK